MLAAITIILLILLSLVLWIALQNREQSKQIANLQNQINQQSIDMATLTEMLKEGIERTNTALANIGDEMTAQKAEIAELKEMVAAGTITPEMVALVNSIADRAEAISTVVEGATTPPAEEEPTEPVEGEENAGE